ncbi:Short chain dehydrogenase sol3 [Lachnellula suecica]|uniref:Short chain dehydrogenase sol3 n=1 Tax=Lachnellula suecica TaxID=602035 RepID=A0A8T9CE83_9HELO|nr:Short chain dehydrogenase sol3 [Lachnellula suecica]
MGLLDFLYSQLMFTPTYPTSSCEGQTIIVTGSNSGLGKEAARHFARLGSSKIILAVRDIKAGDAAKQDIETTTKCNPAILEVWPLDLASYKSVRVFASRASQLPRIDTLVSNAGISTNKWELIQGYECTIAINVISTFYLAMLMLSKLKSSAKEFGIQTHITVVSSEREDNTFEALNIQSTGTFPERYPTSKLLEVLVVRQVAPHLEGSGVILNVLSPGLCHSALAREGNRFLTIMKFLFARTSEMGSRTLVSAATAGPESNGRYVHNGKVDDAALSSFVVSEDGEKASQKVWKELETILESIQPGITESL